MYDNDFHGPDKASSIIGLEIFDDLKIEFWRYSVDFVYESLKYPFLNFPKVQSFKLYYSENQHQGIVSVIGYTHKKEELMGSDQSNYTINLLEIEYASPAQRHFDLVTTYSKDIAVISYKSFRCGYLYDRPVINLTVFKKLKSFIYTTEGRNDSQDSYVVLLKYTNGEEQYYYPYEEKREKAQVEDVGDSTTTTPNPTVCCVKSTTTTVMKLTARIF
ncbi:hypothetical protein MFLAVUS_011053 [Mucor flavus]|uniref:Uncharacterized protein n=1 Tax=Mucor flavus TaxID=439312 RepID=A0ABP9ZEG9_9FUNG